MNEVTMDEAALLAYEEGLAARVAQARARVATARVHTPLGTLIQQIRLQRPPLPLTPVLKRASCPVLGSLADGEDQEGLSQHLGHLDGEDQHPTDQHPNDQHPNDQDAPTVGWLLALDTQPRSEAMDGFIANGVAAGVALVRSDVIVDPYQIFEAAALGIGSVILTVGAQVTPDLSNLIRVCEEVGVEWLLSVHHRWEIDEGLVAITDAFARQAPRFVLAATFHGQPLDHEQVCSVMDMVDLGEDGYWIAWVPPRQDTHLLLTTDDSPGPQRVRSPLRAQVVGTVIS